VNAYENPLDEMVIQASQKSKFFSKESDIILLCVTHKVGYGKWAEIKRSLRRDSRCRFDHLFTSRNEQELQRRVDILVKALEKEEMLSQKRLSDKKDEGIYDDDEEDFDMDKEDEKEDEKEEEEEELSSILEKNKGRRWKQVKLAWKTEDPEDSGKRRNEEDAESLEESLRLIEKKKARM